MQSHAKPVKVRQMIQFSVISCLSIEYFHSACYYYPRKMSLRTGMIWSATEQYRLSKAVDEPLSKEMTSAGALRLHGFGQRLFYFFKWRY
jgi:hypothetical protein